MPSTVIHCVTTVVFDVKTEADLSYVKFVLDRYVQLGMRYLFSSGRAWKLTLVSRSQESNDQVLEAMGRCYNIRILHTTTTTV